MVSKGVTINLQVRLVVPSDNEYDTESYAHAISNLIREGVHQEEFAGLQDVEVIGVEGPGARCSATGNDQGAR